MKKTLIMALTLGLSSAYLQADCIASGCSDVTVDKLYMTASGTLYVGTSGDEKNLNCAGGEGDGGIANVYMSLDKDDAGQNAMYSLLLTAQTTGKTVKIRIEEDTDDCRVAYVTQ